MESGIQSSFIPHDTANAASDGRRAARSRGLSDLIFLLAIVMLVASLALAAGVFLYQEYLQTTSASKRSQLERAKNAFDPALIGQLTRLDDRMHAADTILGKHVAPSLMFESLQQVTLQTVAFRSFDFQSDESQHVSVKMAGTAQSVNSIALQADLLSKSPIFTSPIFTGIDREPDGVHFELAALVNPNAVRYQLSSNPTSAAQSAGAAAATVPVSPFGQSAGGQSQGATTTGR